MLEMMLCQAKMYCLVTEIILMKELATKPVFRGRTGVYIATVMNHELYMTNCYLAIRQLVAPNK